MQSPDVSSSPQSFSSHDISCRNFEDLLSKESIDLDKLKSLAWRGVPDPYRAEVWMVLCGYLPSIFAKRKKDHQRKRTEYASYVTKYYWDWVEDSSGKVILSPPPATTPLTAGSSFTSASNPPRRSCTEEDIKIRAQIRKDVPRTCTQLGVFRVPVLQAVVERVLYIWSCRRPASGYVQGMNDLAAPFFLAFLAEALHPRRVPRVGLDAVDGTPGDQEALASPPAVASLDAAKDSSSLPTPPLPPLHLRVPAGAGARLDALYSERRSPEWVNVYSRDLATAETTLSYLSDATLLEVEADVYWCASALLDRIQSHYTADQRALQEKVLRLEALVKRVDAPVYNAIAQYDISFLTFAFRWLNCLLLREFSPKVGLCLVDTFIAEGDEFPTLLLYTCVALLLRCAPRILAAAEPTELVLFLQNLPTEEYTKADVEELFAEAYRLQLLFQDCPAHTR